MSIELVTKTPYLLETTCPTYRVRLRGGIIVHINEPAPWKVGFRYTCAFGYWYSVWVTICDVGQAKDISYDIGCHAGYTGKHYVIAQRVSDGAGASKAGSQWSDPC